MKTIYSKRITIFSFSLAILCHTVIFLDTELWKISFASPNPVEKQIEVEFVEPQPQKKELPREVVELPNTQEPEEIPEKADFLSDKNAVARDNYTKPDKSAGLPFAEGELKESRNFFPSGSRKEIMPFSEENPDKEKVDREFPKVESKNKEDIENKSQAEFRESFEKKKFSKNLLGKQPQVIGRPEPTYKNKDFSAEEIGGFSLSTYKWEYAPYMNEFKYITSEHWYPPPAFSQLGMIGGKVVLLIILGRDGIVENIEVLSQGDHKSLAVAAVQAVKNANYKPLPKNFPEEKLIITFTFNYVLSE